jgi:hypothetical protein
VFPLLKVFYVQLALQIMLLIGLRDLLSFMVQIINLTERRLRFLTLMRNLWKVLHLSFNQLQFRELVWVNEADVNGRLDKQGNLLNLPYNQRVSEVYRKILSIYTKIQNNKFSDKNIINMFNQNFAYPDDLKPGYAQRNFAENMTKLIRDGYVKKSESERTAGYYFSGSYRDALRYCSTLDYRSKKMLVDYINDNGVDLDTLLLKWKIRHYKNFESFGALKYNVCR